MLALGIALYPSTRRFRAVSSLIQCWQSISLGVDEPVPAVQDVTIYNVTGGTFTLRYSTSSPFRSAYMGPNRVKGTDIPNTILHQYRDWLDPLSLPGEYASHDAESRPMPTMCHEFEAKTSGTARAVITTGTKGYDTYHSAGLRIQLS